MSMASVSPSVTSPFRRRRSGSSPIPTSRASRARLHPRRPTSARISSSRGSGVGFGMKDTLPLAEWQRKRDRRKPAKKFARYVSVAARATLLCMGNNRRTRPGAVEWQLVQRFADAAENAKKEDGTLQRDIAVRSGLTESMVSRILNHETFLTVTEARMMCAGLGLDMVEELQAALVSVESEARRDRRKPSRVYRPTPKGVDAPREQATRRGD